MKTLKKVFIIIGVFLPFTLSAQLTVDEDGWTVIPSSPDTRTIYVSSSLGSDSNDGLSPESPVASISKAKSLVRDGFPDHLLFKRGDEWETAFGLGSFKSGKSASEPIVVGYYGDTGERPLFKLETSFLSSFNSEISNLVFIGLHWYAYKHDPNSPDFESTSKVGVFNMLGFGENILIEDCVSAYAQFAAFSPSGAEDIYYKNLKFRRCIAYQSYAPDSYTIHELYTRTQGLYIARTQGVLIEECLFDHNGWNEQVEGSGPNMFNHNIYMQTSNPNSSEILVKGNIIARGAAHGLQLRSGGTVEDNLFIQNAVNLNIGYSSEASLPGAFGIARNNVFQEVCYMDSLNTDYPRTSARWGIATINLPSVIEDNIFSHALNQAQKTIDEYNDLWGMGGTLVVNNNLEYKWRNKSETPDPSWLDPERRIGHYHQALGKEATTAAFLIEARKRPLKTWWSDYSAIKVNEFIRNGFGNSLDTEPPLPPENLVVANVSDRFIELTWDWARDNERVLGYNIYVDGIQKNETLVKATDYSLFELEPETEYLVKVTSIDIGDNESLLGTELSVSTLAIDTQAPSVPRGLNSLLITDEGFTVQWNTSIDDRALWGYNLFVDGKKSNEEIIRDTTYSVTGLIMGQEYFTSVSAIDPAGNESEPCEALKIRIKDTEAPSTPGNPQIEALTSSSIWISWEISSDNVGVEGYIIYLNGDSISYTNETELTLTDQRSGVQMTFSISAVDADGNISRKSAPISLVLATHNYQSEEFFLYPNPARENINISTPFISSRIAVFNVNGKLISEISSPHSEDLTISLENAEKGIYVIRVFYDEKVFSEKIIVK